GHETVRRLALEDVDRHAGRVGELGDDGPDVLRRTPQTKRARRDMVARQRRTDRGDDGNDEEGEEGDAGEGKQKPFHRRARICVLAVTCAPFDERPASGDLWTASCERRRPGRGA